MRSFNNRKRNALGWASLSYFLLAGMIRPGDAHAVPGDEKLTEKQKQNECERQDLARGIELGNRQNERENGDPPLYRKTSDIRLIVLHTAEIDGNDPVNYPAKSSRDFHITLHEDRGGGVCNPDKKDKNGIRCGSANWYVDANDDFLKGALAGVPEYCIPMTTGGSTAKDGLHKDKHIADYLGIHIEMMAEAKYTAADWEGPNAKPGVSEVLDNTARLMGRIAREYKIDLRHINTVEELLEFEKSNSKLTGVTDHATVAKAWGGDHSDVGIGFPWNSVMKAAKNYSFVPKVPIAGVDDPRPRDGDCDNGEFCYYFNSAGRGSISDFDSSVANYGTTQPSCYEFRHDPGSGDRDGDGECIINNAASVENKSDVAVTVYSGPNYTGEQFVVPPKSGIIALPTELYNKNQSHWFASDGPVVSGGPALSNGSVRNITATGADFSVISDQAATAFWVVRLASEPVPTAAQIVAEAGGNTGTMTASTAFSRTLAGLSSRTAYRLHFVASSNGALSNVWSEAFSTATLPIAGVPTSVDGRILTAEQAGDISDWVEIAQYEKYSLVVRANYINIYSVAAYYDNPAWQYTPYGATMAYEASIVRNRINAWFNGSASGAADNLPQNARLRDYSMQNNATNRLGTCNSELSLADGLSLPSKYQVGVGNDVAFALSWAESANYLSISQFRRGPIANIASDAHAVANYGKVNVPPEWAYGMWLRSPGDIVGTAGALGNADGSAGGRVFQIHLSHPNERGYVYPAVWVDSGIFDNGSSGNEPPKELEEGEDPEIPKVNGSNNSNPPDNSSTPAPPSVSGSGCNTGGGPFGFATLLALAAFMFARRKSPNPGT